MMGLMMMRELLLAFIVCLSLICHRSDGFSPQPAVEAKPQQGSIINAVLGVNGGNPRLGFYRTSCPQAEFIVRDEVSKALKRDMGLAAGLVRLHFHDCFVRGCDASVLIDSTKNNTAEKDGPPNAGSLRGFEIIDRAKARLEAECRKIVSCADILAFAARDGVELSGGFSYQVVGGRRDGRVSLSSETLPNLPPPFANLNTLTQMFATKGLSQNEMITLSGAHTIGRTRCSLVSNRLYNFSPKVSTDPSLDPTYAAQLKKQCPKGSNNTNLAVPMDPQTPFLVDGSYYNNVLAKRGIFPSDQALVSTPAAASQVTLNARNDPLFKWNFAVAMEKMGRIGVLTGNNGEIRSNCRLIN